MKDLIRSEWRRFRWLALLVAVAHTLALVFMSRVMEVQQTGYQNHGMMVLIYMLLGLTLALVQVGSYRQPSRWLWLIHRPLPPARIFAALAWSAFLMLAVGIFIPLLLFLAVTDVFSTQVVDVRHYVALVIALAFAMMAWLAGAHAATSRYKAALAVLLAPVVLAWHLASVWALLVPVIVCTAWLLFIARSSFRANRDAPIRRHTVLFLTALPLQLGFFLLFFQLSKTSLDLVKLMGQKPGRTVLSTDATIDADSLHRSFAQDFVIKGLAQSRDPRAAAWREQLPMLPVADLSPDVKRFPVRHQVTNVGGPRWDNGRNIKWTFSHGRMQYFGRDGQTGEEKGWWGKDGLGSNERFTEVPSLDMTRTTLYAIDDANQRQYELLRLGNDEWFVGTPRNELDRVFVLTNRRVLAYRRDSEAISQFAPLILDWEVAHAANQPVPVGVNIAELLDGWLVSMFYSDIHEFDGFEGLMDSWQQVVHVDETGTTTVVGERHNIRDHKVSMGNAKTVPIASWWASPPLYALGHVPDLLDTGLTQPPRFEMLPDVPVFYALAIALMLLSLIGCFFWLRSTQVTAARRRLWLVTCALIGVPALLSLICLEPRRIACR